MLLAILTTSLVQFSLGNFPIPTDIQLFAEWLLLPQAWNVNLRNPVEKNNNKFVREDGQ